MKFSRDKGSLVVRIGDSFHVFNCSSLELVAHVEQVEMPENGHGKYEQKFFFKLFFFIPVVKR